MGWSVVDDIISQQVSEKRSWVGIWRNEGLTGFIVGKNSMEEAIDVKNIIMEGKSRANMDFLTLVNSGLILTNNYLTITPLGIIFLEVWV